MKPIKAKPIKKPKPDHGKVAADLHNLAVTYRHWLTTGKQPAAKMTKAELQRRVTLLTKASALLRGV